MCVFLLVLATGILSHGATAETGSTVQVDVLLSSSRSWDGQSYAAYPNGPPELSVVKVTIPPHTELPWHKHSMPSAAYVLSGELTVEKKATAEKKILTAGQVLPELVDQLHRGYTKDAPAVLIVFSATTNGMPLVEHEFHEGQKSLR